MPGSHEHMDDIVHMLHMPHIGMRKTKSILAVFVGFWLWQCVRIFFPSLEVHPVYIYIYGLMEIRENSEKTLDFGHLRIKSTFIALGTGLPLLFLSEALKSRLAHGWIHTAVELAFLLFGALVTLVIAEKADCRSYCGLAAAIFIIMMVSHTDGEMLLYSVLRATQTIGGVFIAWLINVKFLPYPPKPGRRWPFAKKKTPASGDSDKLG